MKNLEILEDARISDPYVDRRSGEDRREIYHSDYFENDGLERRGRKIEGSKMNVEKAFQVSAKRVIHFFKQPAHSVGRNPNAHTFEFAGNLSGGRASPLITEERLVVGGMKSLFLME